MTKIIPVIGMKLRNKEIQGIIKTIAEIDDNSVHYSSGGWDDKNTLRVYYDVIFDPRLPKTKTKNKKQQKEFIVWECGRPFTGGVLMCGRTEEEVLKRMPIGQYNIQEIEQHAYEVYIEKQPKKVRKL